MTFQIVLPHPCCLLLEQLESNILGWNRNNLSKTDCQKEGVNTLTVKPGINPMSGLQACILQAC